MGKEEMPSPFPSLPAAGRRADPEVMRVGELVLPLIFFSTQEIGPCTLPVQHNGADPDGRVWVKIAQRS